MADITIKDVINNVKGYLPTVDAGRIMKAYEYASAAHAGQKRYSGEPYIVHPLNTAYFLTDFHPDEDSVVAALLHDVSEDTPRTLNDIEREFGASVRDLVFGLEKLAKVRSRLNEPHAENLRKLFLVMAKDFRVVMIKLCDRLHNISTLQHVPKEKQRRIAEETLEIYAPIAARLGIYRLKMQLEDYAFSFLEPEYYQDIIQQLQSTYEERETYITETQIILQDVLAMHGINGAIDGRRKGIYSIYRKMKRKGKASVVDIFDIFAMRIVLPNIFKHDQEFHGHLYTALGVIHSKFTPLAQRFKDYVAVPKVNGYRSLHTTVMGLGPKNYSQPTEIQIRSQLMHDQAEFGVAAHWLYESIKGASLETLEHGVREGAIDKELFLTAGILKKQLNWMQNLAQLQQSVKNDEELMQDLKTDIFQDRIFVLTPRGEVKDLPRGATPVDFAYAVHTDVGNHCLQAKANGNIVPLHHELHNGDVVEIITRKDAKPKQNWLSFVKMNHTKSRIRSWLRTLDQDKNLRFGKELFNHQLERIGKPPLAPDLSMLKVVDSVKKTFKEREELLEEMGKGTLLPSTLLKKVFSIEEIFKGRSHSRTVKTSLPRGERVVVPQIQGNGRVLIGGRKDMPIRIARCCKPQEKDAIVGFISRGKGVAIHKTSCAIFSDSDRKRLYDAYWVSPQTGYYRVNIRVEVRDRMGLIRDISTVFTNASLNILDFIYHKTGHDGGTARDICVEIQDFDQLDKVLRELEEVPDVMRAHLITPAASHKQIVK